MSKERRRRLAYLDEQELITILQWGNDPASGYLTVTHRDIPEGAEVTGAYYDPARAALVVVLEHEDWEPVAVGALPPELFGACLEKQTYRAVKEDGEPVRIEPIPDSVRDSEQAP